MSSEPVVTFLLPEVKRASFEHLHKIDSETSLFAVDTLNKPVLHQNEWFQLGDSEDYFCRCPTAETQVRGGTALWSSRIQFFPDHPQGQPVVRDYLNKGCCPTYTCDLQQFLPANQPKTPNWIVDSVILHQYSTVNVPQPSRLKLWFGQKEVFAHEPCLPRPGIDGSNLECHRIPLDANCVTSVARLPNQVCGCDDAARTAWINRLLNVDFERVKKLLHSAPRGTGDSMVCYIKIHGSVTANAQQQQQQESKIGSEEAFLTWAVLTFNSRLRSALDQERKEKFAPLLGGEFTTSKAVTGDDEDSYADGWMPVHFLALTELVEQLQLMSGQNGLCDISQKFKLCFALGNNPAYKTVLTEVARLVPEQNRTAFSATVSLAVMPVVRPKKASVV